MTEKKDFVPIVDAEVLTQYLESQNKFIKEKYGNCTSIITDLFSNIETIKVLYGIELKVEIPKELYTHIMKEIIIARNK